MGDIHELPYWEGRDDILPVEAEENQGASQNDGFIINGQRQAQAAA